MHDDIQLPDSIDGYITKGINKGRKIKRARILKRSTATVICFVVMFLLVGIRVSPVMAANVAKIPGLKYIVDMVRFDKGLTSAIDNDYIQRIDKSYEKRGIVFTVKDIIADNSGIIVFYSIENKGGYKSPNIRDAQLYDSTGKELKMSASYGYAPYETRTYEGKIDYHSVNGENFQMPDNIILKTKIFVNNTKNSDDASAKPINPSDAGEPSMTTNNETVLDDVWTVEFSIDKSKFSRMEKVYKIGQSAEVEGQKILFGDIKIYPTKSILTVSFDKSNSKRIFYFEDLKLVDEKGQEWGRSNNGITGSLISENQQTLNFQSNYFYKPKELYITGSSIRALDKKTCYFTVDTEKGQIVYSPNNLLAVSDFYKGENVLSLMIDVRKDQKDIRNSYDISNEVTDANGSKLEIISSGMSSSETNSSINYELKLGKNFKGPITFKIQDYPSKIHGQFKVKVPID